MEQSNYLKYIQKYFTGIVTGVITKLNDTKNPVVYYHMRFLRKNFSIDGNWESINAANTMVMADVVAMDSSLPLKKRDSISKAGGKIPKMGMELKLNEQQLTDLQTLAARPGTEPQLIAKIFQDVPRVIGGIKERNEAIFLEALSTGVCEIDDIENTGTAVRMNYNYANQYGAAVVWSSSSATPLSDLQRIKSDAQTKGDIIIKFLMDRTTFNNLAKTTEAKQFYAFAIGFTGDATQTPTTSKLNSELQDAYGFTIEIIDRSVRYEKNGVQTVQTPWSANKVIGITSESLGDITWATLAEALAPVAGVSYETADDYILVSKFRTNTPSLAEVTRSQARVVPVLTNTDQIYYLDTNTVQA